MFFNKQQNIDTYTGNNYRAKRVKKSIWKFPGNRFNHHFLKLNPNDFASRLFVCIFSSDSRYLSGEPVFCNEKNWIKRRNTKKRKKRVALSRNLSSIPSNRNLQHRLKWWTQNIQHEFETNQTNEWWKKITKNCIIMVMLYAYAERNRYKMVLVFFVLFSWKLFLCATSSLSWINK